MTTVDVGDRVAVRYLAYAGGVETTATVALSVVDPSGTATTPSVTYTAPNQYDASFVTNAAGVWYWTWTVSGTVDDIETGQVTAAAAPGPVLYATLSMLKHALNMPANNTTDDELLTLALLGASRSVEQYCDGRVFNLAAAATARVYGTARKVLSTPLGDRLRVDDIGAVDDLAVAVSSDGITYTAITDYETHPDNALARGQAITGIISPTVSLCDARRVRVTARWGWPEIPTAVQQATMLQASRLYRRKDSPEGVAGSADWGLVRVPNLDPDVKALLAYLTTPLKVA